MSEQENPDIRWELDALKSEYNQHWSHFRHTIDKSYQAFNIHLVVIALLFSAVSLAYEQGAGTIAAPLLIVISVVTWILSEGTISTLVTQRTGYVLYRKVIDVLRHRISEKVNGMLQPEVDFFYDLRVFKPGTAWFNRVNFVILTGSSVIVVCTYLTITNLSTMIIGFTIDSAMALLVSLTIFILSIQKMYYSVISRANTRARGLFRKMQDYENPPTESREIKALKRYSSYLLISTVLLLLTLLVLMIMETIAWDFNVIYTLIVLSVFCVALLILSCSLWCRTREELVC